jgi:hypothetical protein
MKFFGGGILGGLLLVSAIAVLGKDPAVISNFTGGGAQLLSVAMGGSYSGLGTAGQG